MTSEFTLPVELHVGDQSVEVAKLSVNTEDPAVCRQALADLLHHVATYIEEEPSDDQ